MLILLLLQHGKHFTVVAMLIHNFAQALLRAICKFITSTKNTHKFPKLVSANPQVAESPKSSTVHTKKKHPEIDRPIQFHLLARKRARVQSAADSLSFSLGSSSCCCWSDAAEQLEQHTARQHGTTRSSRFTQRSGVELRGSHPESF